MEHGLTVDVVRGELIIVRRNKNKMINDNEKYKKCS
jgi:hypothetical protein